MARLVKLALIAALVGGCASEVVLTGKLYGTRDDKSKPWPGALVQAFDRDGLPYNSVRSNAQGRFRLKVPRGQTIFVEVGDEEHPTASFTGTSGFSSPLEVNLGEVPEIYGVPADELDALRDQFAGCPGLDEGALVLAEVFANDLIDDNTGEHPSLGTVSGTVLPIDGEPIEACYLDEAGEVYDSEATLTGPSATFAVAGVPPGLHTLIVENHLAGGITVQTSTPILVSEAEVVPRFPFLMDSGLIP